MKLKYRLSILGICVHSCRTQSLKLNSYDHFTVFLSIFSLPRPQTHPSSPHNALKAQYVIPWLWICRSADFIEIIGTQRCQACCFSLFTEIGGSAADSCFIETAAYLLDSGVARWSGCSAVRFAHNRNTVSAQICSQQPLLSGAAML